MKTIVLIDFSKYSEADINVIAENILNKLVDNKHFPAPTPTLNEVQLAKNEYNEALTACVDGGKITTQLKKQKRTALEAHLRLLGQYIQLNCNNDANLVLSTGYKVRKPRAPIGTLPKPENFTILPGPNPASVKLKVDAVKGARMYIFQYTLAPADIDTKWDTLVDPKRSLIINGLTRGKEYAFRVAAKGTASELVYSDIICVFVA